MRGLITQSLGFAETYGFSSREILTLIDADQDCTQPARQIIRAQTDLRLYIEKRERA